MTSRNLRRDPKELTIIVSGGTGTATVEDFYGDVTSYAIDAPSAAASYDIELLEDFPSGRSYGRGGEAGLVGDRTIRDNFGVWHDLTVTISGATVDGTYYVVVWC